MSNPRTCGSSQRSIKESTRSKYDGQWSVQDADVAGERRKHLSMVADPLLSMVHPLAGKVVADLGVGTGALAFRALELTSPKELIGLDFSAPGLFVAREIAGTERFKERDVEFVRADLESIPVCDSTFDVVLSQATLNLLPDKRRAFREMSRITKPGGKIAVSDAFRTTGRTGGESWEQCIAGAVTVAEFSELASGVGFVIAGQLDLTTQVKQMIAGRRWDWPEFLQHNMDYRCYLLIRH